MYGDTVGKRSPARLYILQSEVVGSWFESVVKAMCEVKNIDKIFQQNRCNARIHPSRSCCIFYYGYHNKPHMMRCCSYRTHGFCSFREQSGAVSSVIDEIYRLGKDCSGMPYGLFHALIEPFLFDGRGFSVARKVYFTDVVCIIHWCSVRCAAVLKPVYNRLKTRV